MRLFNTDFLLVYCLFKSLVPSRVFTKNSCEASFFLENQSDATITEWDSYLCYVPINQRLGDPSSDLLEVS